MKKNIAVVDLDTRRRKKEIVSKIKSIPPLPAAAQEVLSIVAENPKDIRRLEQVIMHDPSLSSQLLKVANCAAYYPAARITTVHRAIVFLGFAEVKNIALSLSISAVFKGSKSKAGFDRQRFWEHSIGTAMISRLIAVELDLEETDIYFTCGLLHDLGRAVMDTCFQREWKEILELAQSNQWPLLRAEREFGLPHNIIGAWLVRNWALPGIYSKVIASHHLPPGHSHFNFDGALIQLADQLCHEMGIGILSPPRCKKSTLANYLGLGEERITILERHIQKIGEIAEAITSGML